MGFSNEQRLHSALKSDDVKSGLIEKIAKATNKSVCFFYPGENNTIATEQGIAISGSQNVVNRNTERFISLLEKKDEQMDKMIEVITDLTSKIK